MTTLGILCVTPDHVDAVVQLTTAARKKGVRVMIRLVGAATALLQQDAFIALLDLADVSVSQQEHLPWPVYPQTVPGGPGRQVGISGFAQWLAGCDRHLVF